MIPLIRSRTAGHVVPGVFSKYGCTIQAWVVGWAVTVYASAAFQTFAVQDDIPASAIFYAIFQTADNVPPIGKLTLGGLMALGLAMTAWRNRDNSAHHYHRAGHDAVIVTALAMVAALSLPVGYYPAIPTFSVALVALHILAGCLGGMTIQLANAVCARRKERESR
jgi:hypothetical protein